MSILVRQLARHFTARHSTTGNDNRPGLLHACLEIASRILYFLRRAYSLEWRISLRSSASCKNEEVVFECRSAGGTCDPNFLGDDVNTFGRGEDEFELACLQNQSQQVESEEKWRTYRVLLESLSNRSKNIFIRDLTRKQSSRGSHAPIKMGVRRQESDLEGTSLSSLLQDPMGSADSCEGSAENNDLLHILR